MKNIEKLNEKKNLNLEVEVNHLSGMDNLLNRERERERGEIIYNFCTTWFIIVSIFKRTYYKPQKLIVQLIGF